MKQKESEQDKKNFLLEKSLWAAQRASKEANGREKMSVMQWESEETKMKSKIKSLET